jgi:opacity protein-like surface antigen
MKKRLAILVALAAITLPAISMAADQKQRPGPYFSAFIGATSAKDSDATTYDYLLPQTFHDQAEFDPGIFVGGSGGYDFGIVRLEGELSYRDAEMKTITDRDTGERYHNIDGSLGVLAMMVNAFFDLHNSTPVTPYVGGGIGLAAFNLTDTYGTDSGGSRAFIYSDGTDTVFAYQVGCGLEIALNQMLSLDLAYRYFVTDTATFDDDWSRSTRFKYESHNGSLGLRLKF